LSRKNLDANIALIIAVGGDRQMSISKFREQEKESDNSESISMNVIKGKIPLSDIFEGLNSKTARVKYKCAKILRYISQKKPEMLYPRFDYFVSLLDTQNQILKWNAIDIIANLNCVDSDRRFEKVFLKFYNKLKEGSLITSGHIIESSANIIKARPELKGKITEILLQQDDLPLPTEECRSIIGGKTIKLLSDCYDQIDNKKEIVDFVIKQLQSQRPATRKKAGVFLKKHSR
jgi:hypothetical protein